jgi:hypothetical protein
MFTVARTIAFGGRGTGSETQRMEPETSSTFHGDVVVAGGAPAPIFLRHSGHDGSSAALFRNNRPYRSIVRVFPRRHAMPKRVSRFEQRRWAYGATY